VLRFLSVQSEEAPSALLVMLYFFLAMACVGAVKSLQNSLYLINLGFDWKLPILYASLSLLAGPIVLLYQRLTRGTARATLPVSTLGFFLVTFTFFIYSLGRVHQSWVYAVFYAWGGMFNLLLPTLGWVVSYELYNVRAAKRVFGLLATGGVLGGAFGSYCTVLAAGHQEWLLLQVLAMMASLIGLLVLIYRAAGRRSGSSGRSTAGREVSPDTPKLSTVTEMLRLPYVRFLAGMVFVAALSTTLIDLNYLWFVRDKYPGDVTALKQLIGNVLTILYLASAVLQVLGTRRILQRFGLPAVLLVSPAGLGGASLFAAVWPVFPSVVGVKALGGILASSLHRTGVEMMYVPLASRYASLPLKSFIDLVVYKAGDASGAFLFLVLLQVLTRPVSATLALQTAAFLLWGYLAWRIGKEYILHLRHSVQEGLAVRLAAAPEEGHAEEILLELLKTPDPVRTRLAFLGLKKLDFLEEEPEPEFPYEGEGLLHTNMSAVAIGPARWMAAATSLLDHPDPEIGAAALHLLVRRDPAGQLRRMRETFSSEWIPSNLFLCYMDRYVEQPGKLLRPTNVLRWCQALPQERQAVMARLMGKSRDRAFLPVLRQWAQQESGSAALAAIEATGRFAEPRLLPWLCAFLASYRSRNAARRALSFYGEGAVVYLAKLLRDPAADPRIKREIPLILGDICCSSSRSALAGALYHTDPVVSYRALQALNRIRDAQDLSYATETFLPLIEFWARQYYELAGLESVQEADGGRCARLLRRALQERKQSALERIFRILELFLPRGDAYYCYRVLTEHRHELRDHAIELIDAQLNPRLKAILLPVLAEAGIDELVRVGRELYFLPESSEGIVSDALTLTDPWFRCCVLAATREAVLRNREVGVRWRESVQLCCGDTDKLVRETARWTLEGFSSPAKPPTETEPHAQYD